jgi:hypothetical protein
MEMPVTDFKSDETLILFRINYNIQPVSKKKQGKSRKQHECLNLDKKNHYVGFGVNISPVYDSFMKQEKKTGM